MKKLLKIFAVLAVMSSLIISCEIPEKTSAPKLEAWYYNPDGENTVYVVGRKENRLGYIMTFMKAASIDDYHNGNFIFSIAGQAYEGTDGWCRVNSGSLMNITGVDTGHSISGTMKFEIRFNGNINFECSGTPNGEFDWAHDNMIKAEN